MIRYDNTPTVVVVRVPFLGGLLAIRRQTLPGPIALPGGFRLLGQTWQGAGAREVSEETIDSRADA